MSQARNTIFALQMGIEEDLMAAIVASVGDERSPLVQSEEVKATERRERDLGPSSGQATWQELLYYLDLGQKIDLASRLNDAIRAKFALDERAVKKLVAALTPLVPIRNRVCHGRPLEPDDFSLTVRVVSDVLTETFFPFDKLASVYQRLRTESNDYPFTMVIPTFWSEGQPRLQHNLPTPDFEDTGFVGRDHDRKSLGQLLIGAYPVVNVTGEGGLGKTSLALRCLYDLVESRTTQFEAIVWTTMKTNRLTPAGIQTIVGSLGNEVDALKPIVDMFQPASEDADRNRIYDQLIEIMDVFPILLAIDNLESVDVDALRPLLLRIPHPSKVLLTSRIGMGDVEARYALDPLSPKDGVQLLRRVARLMNVEELTQRDDASLKDICARLFFNPLLIRWFVEGYTSGHSIPSLLHSTGSFKTALKFCFQNVYDRLGTESKRLLRILSEVPGPLSEVEVALVSGMRDIEAVRSSLRYLQGSNLLERSQDQYGATVDLTMWQVTDFARMFISTYDRPSVTERKAIASEYRALLAGRKQPPAQAQGHPFHVQVIAARTTDEAQVLRLLRRAQELGADKDFRAALTQIEEARLLQPGFFEVFRVSAQVKALASDDRGAEEDFRMALDLAGGLSQPLLVFYSQFLRSRANLDDAAELLETIASDSSAAPQLVIEYAWLLLLRGDAREASALFARVAPSLLALGGSERTVYVTQHVATLRELAEEIPISRIKDASKPVSEALRVLANGCPLIGIDRAVEREGQRCFQLAAQVIAADCDRELWEQVKESVTTIAQFLPLVGSDTSGTAELEAKCPAIASSDDYRRVVEPAGARAAGSRIKGTLGRIPWGRDYGFVHGSDGVDYFVFRTAFRSRLPWEDLWEKDPIPVEFLPGQKQPGSDRAPRAQDVLLSELPTGLAR